MRVKYTPEQELNIINKFNELKNYKEVSEYFNIPINSCKSILNRKGYILNKRKLKIDECKGIELINKSKILLNNHKYSFNELCREININPNTFKNYLFNIGDTYILEKCNSNNYKKTALTDINKLKIIELEQQGKGNDVIGKLLKINGTSVRRYLIEYYGVEKYKERHNINKFKTPWYNGFLNDRGDRFHSTLEMLVADFLFENNIKYKTQAYIKFNNEKFIYPDFYLDDYKIYIEVFGMSEVSYYINSMKEKIKLYKKNNIDFIGIYYKNFKKNNWKELLINKLNIK